MSKNWRITVKIFKSLIVCLSLVLVSQGAAAQDTKIGVLNALQALFNSDAARVVQENWSRNLTPMRLELKSLPIS